MRTVVWLCAICLLFAVAVGAVAEIASPAQAEPTILDGQHQETENEASRQMTDGGRPAEIDLPDDRLAQKVTYKAKRKRAADICDDLSKTTGVRLIAGRNNADWRSRDRRLNIFVKDIPLLNLMNSMGRVLRFKWVRGKTDPPKYRFYMYERTYMEAEAQLQGDEERFESELKDRRGALLRDLARIGELSPEEIAKLKDDNPVLYLYAKHGMAKALSGFFGAAPEVADAWLNGRQETFGAELLSAEARQALLPLAEALWSTMIVSDRELPARYKSVDRLTVRTHRRMDLNRNNEAFSHTLGDLVLSPYPGGMGGIDGDLADPGSEVGRLHCGLAAQVIDENMTSEEEINALVDRIADSGQFVTAGKEDAARRCDFLDPVEDHADEPSLHRKLKMEFAQDANYMESFLETLAEQTGLSVVSDGFFAQPRHGLDPRVSKERELKDILDGIAESFLHNWQKRGDRLEFRNRDWRRNLSWMVSEALLERWREILETTGTIDIEDLAQMSELSVEQSRENLMNEPVLDGAAEVVGDSRRFLSAYRPLNREQRKAVFTTVGLDMRSLDFGQWPAMEQLIKWRNQEFLQNPDAEILLFGARARKGKQFTYAFRLVTSDDLPPLEWEFTTPLYEKPKEEKAKEKTCGKPDGGDR